MKHRRIGILGHAGTQNLGDEAIIAAVIQNVRARYPAAEITCFTTHPEDTERRHGIRSFPIRRVGQTPRGSSVSPCSPPEKHPVAFLDQIKSGIKVLPLLYRTLKGIQRGVNALKNALLEPLFLVNSYRSLRGTRLLIIAGSQQLNDAYGGPWGFPYTLFKWTALARLARAKVVFLSVGAGPLSSPLSRFFCRRALHWASYRSYRDDLSSKLVESFGVRGENPVVPDLVYSLRIPETYKRCPHARPVVGTNPVPFFDGRYWPTDDSQIYGDYVRKIAAFVEWLADTGHQVALFPTQLRADPPVIADVQKRLNGHGKDGSVQVSPPFQGVEDLLSELADMDFVVANRYHGILLSVVLNKPVLGLAYHDKSKALLEQVGAGEYALGVEDLDLHRMQERFLALESRSEAVTKKMAENIGGLRAALDRQYDQVFALLGAGC